MAKSLPPSITVNIDKSTINDAYLPYWKKIYRYEIYFGSRGSGKSLNFARKVITDLSTIPGRNLLCLRKTQISAGDSQWAELKKAIKFLFKGSANTVWRCVDSPRPHATCINGNKILFISMEDAENAKSITFEDGDLTDIWVEEATDFENMDDLITVNNSLRSMTQPVRLCLTFNPVLETHPIKKFIEEYLIPSSNGDYVYLRTTYKDNKFVTPEYAAQLESLKLINPYKYMVDALGQWGVAGQSVFPATMLNDRLTELERQYRNYPPVKGRFSYERDERDAIALPDTFKFYKTGSGEGEITVYKFPETGHPYVVALDPSGETGDDWVAAHVCDNFTDEQVATLHVKVGNEEAVYQAYGLCKMYNNALYCPEINMGETFLQRFKDLKYTNIYQRGTPVDAYSDGYAQKLGWRTTANGAGDRKLLIENCIEWVGTNVTKINDPDTIREMLSFTQTARKTKGIFMGASAGSHDDLVMAFAIWLKAREQQTRNIIATMEKVEGFWLDWELQDAMKQGKITRTQLQEYKRTHSDGFGHKPFVIGKRKKVNKYDR